MKITPKIILLIIFALSVVFPTGVKAQDYEAIFDAVCKKSIVTKELAIAIAQHESNLEPLALNIAGKSFFPKNRAEAKALIEQAQSKKLSYDVGLMQINSYWTNKWGINPEELLDPEANIKAGVKILSIAIEKYGFSWTAVGSYHSPNAKRAKQYAWSIYTMTNNRARKQPAQYIRVGGKNIGNQEKRYTSLLLRRGSTNHNGTSNTHRIIRF